MPQGRIDRLRDALGALDRLNESLSYRATLERGFAIVRAEGRVVKGVAQAARAATLDVEFADGHVTVGRATLRSAPRRAPRAEPPPGQGSLL